MNVIAEVNKVVLPFAIILISIVIVQATLVFAQCTYVQQKASDVFKGRDPGCHEVQYHRYDRPVIFRYCGGSCHDIRTWPGCYVDAFRRDRFSRF